MSRSRKLLCALLALILVGVMGVAWAEDYTYTIRIFSSNQGSFADGADMLVYHVTYGTRISFNPDSVVLKDPGKYSIKGLREAGKDNDTVRASFAVTRDQDYVVAYSVLGDPVAYTVRFVDRDGQALAPAKTYYGNVGDRPVIAFLYIEGYQPQAYNLTRALKDNAAENDMTFVYTKIKVTATAVPVTNTPTPTDTIAPAAATPVAPATTAPVAVTPGTTATTAPVSTTPKTPETTAPVSATPKTPETTAPVSATPKTPETTAPVSATPKTPETTAPVSATPKTPETTAPVSATPKTPETTAPVSATSKMPETTAPVSATPKTPEATAPVSATPKTSETTAPASTTPKVSATTAPVATSTETNRAEATATNLASGQNEATAWPQTAAPTTPRPTTESQMPRYTPAELIDLDNPDVPLGLNGSKPDQNEEKKESVLLSLLRNPLALGTAAGVMVLLLGLVWILLSLRKKKRDLTNKD